MTFSEIEKYRLIKYVIDDIFNNMEGEKDNEQTKDLTVIKEQIVLGKDFKVYGSADEPLFLAKDVAEWIEYAKTGNGNYDVSSMLDVLDEDEKIKIFCTIACRKLTESLGRANRLFITEFGLYELLMLSHKPIAKKCQ